MIEIKYKLTDRDMRTKNGFQWKLGEWRRATGDIHQGLCSNAWLHCYGNPSLALFMNPVHANILHPRLFKAEVIGPSKKDKGLKEGYRRMRLVEELKFSNPTLTQKIAFGILCGKKVYKDKKWNKWADDWLSGDNRSTADAADAAAYAVDTAADATAYATATAYAAANAANAATDTIAYAVNAAAYAADAAADATAYAADSAADAAANAANDAAYAIFPLDVNFIKIAQQAMKY